ncbi:MAG: sugar phosphate isomerase/epimerase family protein [Planctomycetota bacterium]|jgi:hexulose-6-phosphate isomerase
MAKRKTAGLSKGISYWSFPGGMENRADVISVLSHARQLGFASVELGVSDTGVLTLDATRSECRALARAGEAAGVGISALATNLYWATNLSAAKAAERSRAVEITKRMIEKARWLSADALVVVPGWVRSHFNPQAEAVPYDEAHARARESLRKCVKTAEKHRVTLAVLNAWSGLLVSPLEFRDFLDRLRSKRVTACLDVANATLAGCAEYWAAILGKRVFRVRVRDVRHRFEKNAGRGKAFRGFARGLGWGYQAAFCELGSGSVSWPAVMTALRKARYRGPLTALSRPPAPGLVEHSSRFLDKLIGMR